MQSTDEIVARAFAESIEVKRAVLERELPLIAYIVRLMVTTFGNGGKVVFFGNGGSAADAQHVAAELVARFMKDREALPAIALTTDSSLLTAIGNDFSFDDLYARQVRGLVRPGDLAVGISTSGNSRNVIAGLCAAKEKGAATLGFTGGTGGKLKDVADVCFCAPSDVTARIQEAHITVWHAVCEAVEAQLFPEQ